MLHRICLLLLIGFASAIGSTEGATIYVPDDHSSIQDAMVAAADGDLILVRPGTYVENIEFLGKAVTLRSEKGPAVTTIDGGQPVEPNRGCVVLFEWREGRDSVIEGFTLVNGTGRKRAFGTTYGGGIECYRNCSPLITGNVIVDCTADVGGGISCYSECNAFISNNTISGCASSAIACRNSRTVIAGNIIVDNWSDENGGGICCWESQSDVIVNNVIAGNSAVYGGGIYTSWCDYSLANNTIVGNSADEYGAGICCRNRSRPTMISMIIWGNTSPEGQSLYVGDWHQNPSIVTISHSDVMDGQSSVLVKEGCTLNWGDGMIDVDPLFADTAGGDYHIAYQSPCRDSGTELFPFDLPKDFERDSRFHGDSIDMGADEFHPHLYFHGRPVPGGDVSIRIVGEPGTSPVSLGSSPRYQETPLITRFGPLFLRNPFIGISLPAIPPSGIHNINVTVPASWTPGPVLAFQGFLGPFADPGSILTNHCVLIVE